MVHISSSASASIVLRLARFRGGGRGASIYTGMVVLRLDSPLSLGIAHKLSISFSHRAGTLGLILRTKPKKA